MLLPMKVAQGVRAGSIDLAFRNWRRQDVRPGQEFRTSAGVVRVVAVDVVDPSAISDADAVRAGWPDAVRLRRRLAPGDDVETYRVSLEFAGEDPRIALRESADLSEDDVADLDRRLERLDRASSYGRWTLATLRLILERPEVRAPDLAASFGRETAPFKIDVRKLKNLGLTISHSVGYEISPRGAAYLARTTRTD
ncbi:hypothetical protein [Nocardioides sp. R-C-SC26]|uniref:hypothetical protein n=1 Tax=Nocardioides sp. R-C-SC26 TaxID=2870414 RepID=UPI001E2846DE|nr:hypothetical protein [Nocardioides sp. R-C-SC26]